MKLQKHHFLRILDALLLVTGVSMFITDEPVLLFHVVIMLLTIGAFYWPFRSSVIRSIFWVTADSLYILHAVNTGKTGADELIEIPLMTVILVIIFLIAQQRSKAEQQAQRLNIELEQRITELNHANQELEDYTQKLRQTQAQLIQDEKMSALGHLVAGIAHEINNPLGAIQALIENIIASLEQSLLELPVLFQTLSPERQADFFALVDRSKDSKGFLSSREERQLKRDLTQTLTEQSVENAEQMANYLSKMGIATSLEPFMGLLLTPNNQNIFKTAYHLGTVQNSSYHIQLAVTRASRIVFALKNYIRQDPGGVKIKADIADGIDTVLTIYHNQLSKGIEVTKDYNKVSQILCHPDELMQVWSNLIGNAIQAIHHRGKLAIAVREEADRVIVEIEDSGSGIPSEIQDRIFEPFFTTKPPGEGSGLGLHIVRQIIERHGGKIVFATRFDGTVFRVCFPIQ
ncbi:sensor histidine kinase [Altericista sp. CCNU0014]|uniref:sensor histidine kinase n=1 Tax=Altericista sp. CCNU0014 TaxID=3082949 RepID=UPI00384BA7EE